MPEQVCMSWGAVKVRRGPKAKQPRPPTRKCACGCGLALVCSNKTGYAWKCWKKSPRGRAHNAEIKKQWYAKLKTNPAAFSKYSVEKHAKDMARHAQLKCDPEYGRCRDAEKVRRAVRRRSSPPVTLRWLLAGAKGRARARGLPFSITPADLEPLPVICPVLGMKLLYGSTGRFCDASASIDRIDPALGYVPSNVRIISMRANVLKGNGTPSELAAVAVDAAKCAERHGLRAVRA